MATKDRVVPADGFPMPKHLAKERGADLLLEACNLFGINPDPAAVVRYPLQPGQRKAEQVPELMSWKFYQGDGSEPDAVVVLTAGGVKLKLYRDPSYVDPDTEATLRRWFRAWTVDPKTKDIVPSPLPEDLTLPREAVTGLSASTDHQYVGGYLRAGPKESDRRAQARAQAQAAIQGGK